MEYSVADVDMVIEGERRRVRVGVSDTLPRSVLAGTDVISEFGRQIVELMTRHQCRQEQREEDAQRKKEEESGPVAKPFQEEEMDDKTGGLDTIDDELFEPPGKPRKTRAQKRGARRERHMERKVLCDKKTRHTVWKGADGDTTGQGSYIGKDEKNS